MKVFLTVLLLLFCINIFGQKKTIKRTYDYLTGFERWKVIIDPDNSFILTTNELFRPDTVITIKGTIKKSNLQIQFLADTSTLEDKFLLKGSITNEQLIAQSQTFTSVEDYILFKNGERYVYDTFSFSNTSVATYSRSDKYWTNLIILNQDSTYEISEYVHAIKEYEERGTWSYKNGFISLQQNPKDKKWIKRYATNAKFYMTDGFLIGCLVSKKGDKTYFYFNKQPIRTKRTSLQDRL